MSSQKKFEQEYLVEWVKPEEEPVCTTIEDGKACRYLGTKDVYIPHEMRNSSIWYCNQFKRLLRGKEVPEAVCLSKDFKGRF